MSNKLTVFRSEWLLDPNFSCWLKSVAHNIHQAHCSLCNETFELSNMGCQALISHKDSEMHIKLSNQSPGDSDNESDISFKSEVPSGPPNDNENREIRLNLRTLLNETTGGGNLIGEDVAIIEEKLQSSNEIFRKIKMTREAALDAKVLYSIADVGKEKSRVFMTDVNNFNTADFARKISELLHTTYSEEGDGRELNKRNAWIKFGQCCSIYLKRAPILNFMYGSFERGAPTFKEPKPKAPRNMAKENLTATAPVQKLAGELEKKEMTTVEVDRIHRCLIEFHKAGGYKPICYFEFVINPFSYSQTIENIFYTSFLFKDGHARLSLDEDQLPVISPVSEDERQESEMENCNSIVMTLDKDDWGRITEEFKIQNTVIPTRPQRYKPLLKNKFKGPSSFDDDLSDIASIAATQTFVSSQPPSVGSSPASSRLPSPSRKDSPSSSDTD